MKILTIPASSHDLLYWWVINGRVTSNTFQSSVSLIFTITYTPTINFTGFHNQMHISPIILIVHKYKMPKWCILVIVLNIVSKCLAILHWHILENGNILVSDILPRNIRVWLWQRMKFLFKERSMKILSILWIILTSAMTLTIINSLNNLYLDKK